MLFNSALYGAFLVLAYTVFWALRRHRLPRTVFLVLASYFFYFYGTWDTSREQSVPLGPLAWSALCLGVIFVGSTLDFFIGLRLAATENPHARRALLLASVLYYLGVLAIFKYFNFASDSIAQLAGWLGVKVSPAHLRLVLPFGISFFTFETMSYTIDVYRREIEPSRRYLDYLLFVCFFPHLVAGPIVRPRTMLPQLAAPPVHDPERAARGLYMIGTGLMKKMVIGDTLSVNLVARVFDNPERYSSLEVAVAIYAYAIQIYADFSGYTDVARGSSLLFGYELPENFDAPYTSTDLQEFWRKWHISLSSWLRDYLYIPLGGNKGSSLATYRNLLLTMVLGGLWHGASWNFVIWGALHGGGLAVNRAWSRRVMPPREGVAPLRVRAMYVLCTFHFVCFAWIFFRAPTFAHATLMLRRLGKLTWDTPNLAPKVLVVLAIGLCAHFVPRRIDVRLRDWFATQVPAPLQGVLLAACGYVLRFASEAKAEPFVYGQF